MPPAMTTPKIPIDSVTSRPAGANPLLMAFALRESAGAKQSVTDLEHWMVRYQQADPDAPRVLIVALSPPLLRLFKNQIAIREHAVDLLQETWMRIHRVRHTYRPGEPVLPWVYAIARRVGIDGYRRIRRITSHETAMDVLPEIGSSTISCSLPYPTRSRARSFRIAKSGSIQKGLIRFGRASDAL